MRWTITGGLTGLLAVLVGVAIALIDPAPATGDRAYDQSNPKAALASIFERVEAGDASRLDEAIHADGPAMRAAIEEVGALAGTVQDLGAAASERFPGEVARLREEIASDPGRVFRGGPPGRTGSVDPQDGPGREALRALMADPFGWLLAQRERLDAVKMDDERAAITVDGRPAFGVGLLMRRGEDGAWRVELPLNVPAVREYAPRNEDEWFILGSMFKTVRTALDEVATDVRRGRARDMEDAARLAGEKALGPIVMCFFAYRQAIEAREDG